MTNELAPQTTVIKGEMPTELATRETTITPEEFDRAIEFAAAKAKSLAKIVESEHLYTTMGQGKHIHVEAWITIGKGYGLLAGVRDDAEILYNPEGQEIGARAYAIIRDRNGTEVGGAPGFCMRTANWTSKPIEQLISMAGTRAVSKAFRLLLSDVVVLAGYSPTPYEEMDSPSATSNPPPRPQQQPQQQPIPRQQPPQQAPQQAVAIEQDETEYGVCPMHNEPWRGSPPEITEKYGLLLSHSQQGGGYCKFGVIYKDIFISSFAGAFGNYTDPAGIQWLKENYGNRTWSKLEWIEQLQAVEELQEQSLAAIRPEATQRLSVIEAEEDGPPDARWEVTV